ncbi:hypothetical protein [Dyadobacter sp. CY343]|uniref:hypothetical protein n=1 Tax=Dyadobacter sp. CY343 TaxID=2907299 RepID=UPI001F167490|nr:hypothetical protein [Dyadobacter sp. CY343]
MVKLQKQTARGAILMKPGEWQFDWLHINESISIYYRFRQEQTSDGMERPYIETLAYMQKITNTLVSPCAEYRALLHDAEQIVEMDAERSIYPMQIMGHIQKHFSDS